MFVDRDRAAAVSGGTKDIRSAMKGRKAQLDAEHGREDEDDSWIFTYIKQGAYELK